MGPIASAVLFGTEQDLARDLASPGNGWYWHGLYDMAVALMDPRSPGDFYEVERVADAGQASVNL